MSPWGRSTALAAALILALRAFAPVPAAAANTADQQRIVDEARQTYKNFEADPNMEWFPQHLKETKALLIIPTLFKGAFIVGLEGGSGVLLVRDEETGKWSNPAFYTMFSGSFGLQAGIQWPEVILVVRTKKGLDSLLTSSFKLGADVSVAAGPTGAGAKLKTADIYAYARSQGVFVGVSVDGSFISTQEEWNSAYYDKPGVKPHDILVLRNVSNKMAEPLVETLDKATQ